LGPPVCRRVYGRLLTLAPMNEKCHDFTWRESVSEQLLGIAALNPVRAPPDIIRYGTVNVKYSITISRKLPKVRVQIDKRL
jgi:hypothetical protein